MLPTKNDARKKAADIRIRLMAEEEGCRHKENVIDVLRMLTQKWKADKPTKGEGCRQKKKATDRRIRPPGGREGCREDVKAANRSRRLPNDAHIQKSCQQKRRKPKYVESCRQKENYAEKKAAHKRRRLPIEREGCRHNKMTTN